MKRTVGDLVWSLTPPARGAMLLTSQLTAWTLRVRPRGDAHARCRPIGHVELTFGRVHFPVDRVRVETVGISLADRRLVAEVDVHASDLGSMRLRRAVVERTIAEVLARPDVVAVLLLSVPSDPVPETLADVAEMTSAFNRGYPDVAAWARAAGVRP